MGLFIAVLKFGGYIIVSYALIKFTNGIKEISNKDEEPEINEIIKEPRLRR